MGAAGSTYAGLTTVAVMEAGAAGGSSERSWRESSGSGMSSNGATKCVAGLGVGVGGASGSNDVCACASCADDESVCAGAEGGRVVKADRAGELPVVEAVDGVEEWEGADSRRESTPVLATGVDAVLAQRPDVDEVPADDAGAAAGSADDVSVCPGAVVSRRESTPVLATGVDAVLAQRPDVDAVPADEAGADDGGAPARVDGAPVACEGVDAGGLLVPGEVLDSVEGPDPGKVPEVG